MRLLLPFLLPAAAGAAQIEVLTLLNWQRLPVGEGAVMEGGAVVARSQGPAAGFNNPAGLARLERPTVSGTVNAVEYTRVAARAPGGTANADDLALKPNLVGFASVLDGRPAGWAFTLANPITWSSGIEVRTENGSGSRSDDGRSSLEATAIGLSAGWTVHEGLSLGGAVEGWITDYRYDAGTTAEDATTLLTATYTESGRQLDLRLALGAQWAGERWRGGMLLRSPGLRLTDQGSVSASTTSGDGATTVLSRVRDSDVGFDLPLPWALNLGLAWLPEEAPGLEVELDLALSGGSGATTVLRGTSGSTTTISGGLTTSTAYTLPGRSLDLRTVVNPRLGLSYRFPNPLAGHTVRAHLGGYLERSPVGASDVFSRLDLLGGTAGVSLEKGPMVVSLGGAFVTNGTLSDAIGFVSSPASGLNPTLEDANAAYAVRSFVLSIASSYRF